MGASTVEESVDDGAVGGPDSSIADHAKDSDKQALEAADSAPGKGEAGKKLIAKEKAEVGRVRLFIKIIANYPTLLAQTLA